MVVPIVSIPASIEAGLAPYRDLFPRPETYQHIKDRTYAAILSRSRAGNGVWGFLRMRWRLN